MRSRETINAELRLIKGISDQTALKLLNEFKSVKQIKETSEAEFVSVIGKAKAKLVWDYYNNEQ